MGFGGQTVTQTRWYLSVRLKPVECLPSSQSSSLLEKTVCSMVMKAVQRSSNVSAVSLPSIHRFTVESWLGCRASEPRYAADNGATETSFNQSINQSNFYSANIPGEARLRGAIPKSVFNSKIEETIPRHHQAIGHASIYGRKSKSNRSVLRYFLKVATEMAERTDSSRLFQWDGSCKWKALLPVLTLTLRADRVIPLFDLSKWDGSDVESLEWRQIRLIDL